MVKIGALELPDYPLLLAPMEDVSDTPFRKLCKQHGADLVFTEFISSEGLIRNAKKSLKKMDIFKSERPIGIQIFGNNIDSMVEASKIISEVKPDIIDINYGCPVKKVACKGAGAGILQDIPKMIKMTAAVVKSTSIPVTVKTRLGWDEQTLFIEDVALKLQEVGIKALSIHGRTRKQMYKGNADWSLIKKIKENQKIHIPIFGNGDVNSPQAALKRKQDYSTDGIMIGRGAIGYPWIFNEIKHFLNTGELLPPPSISELAETVKEHLLESIKWKGERRGIFEMRKHYNNYFRGIKNFKPIRIKLNTSENKKELLELLGQIGLQFQ